MTLTSGSSAGGCWTLYPAKATNVTAGAPLVDPVARRVYLLSGVGVLSGVFAGPTPKVTFKALLPLVSFKLQASSTHGHGLRVFALDKQRHLFVTEGQKVRRLELAKASGGKVPSRPFVAGRFKEAARDLSLSADGTLLEVVRARGGTLHSLAAVCLKRCPQCLCK